MQNQNHQAWGAGSLAAKADHLRQPIDISFIVDYVDTTAVDGGAVFTADSAAVGDSNNGLGTGI